MLEFLSARFINSGVLLTILYFFNASWNMRITKASYFLINFLFDYNDAELSNYLNEQLDIFLNMKQQN